MTNITQAEVIKMASMLEARGTKLRPSADAGTLAELETLVGGPISYEARIIFSVFDGFEADMADDATMVCLWPIKSIKTHLREHGGSPKGQVFGDYFLSAELFCYDLKDNNSAVWWNERNIIAANSLLEFLQKVVRKTVKP